MSNIIELNDTNFEEILEKNEIVVIDFYADWCGPCKTYSPVFEKTALASSDDNVVFCKVNTELSPELSGAFNIRSIPHTIILRDKYGIFSQSGVISQEGLEDVVSQVKALNMDDVVAEIEAQNEKK